jgi:hypothetical protein
MRIKCRLSKDILSSVFSYDTDAGLTSGGSAPSDTRKWRKICDEIDSCDRQRTDQGSSGYDPDPDYPGRIVSGIWENAETFIERYGSDEGFAGVLRV